jgi:serine protease AprX
MRKAHSPTLVLLISALLLIQLTTSAFAGISFIAGEGVVLTGAEGVVLTGAEGVVLTGAEGVVLTGAEGVVLTGAEGVVLTGAEALTYTGVEGVVLTGAESGGLCSFDPELAWLLNLLPDSSAVNVFVIFHQMPTEDDFTALRSAGVVGGTIFHNLPIVLINATRSQIAAISTLSSVRTIYSNKTIEFFTHDTRVITGQTSVVSDPLLTQRNANTALSGGGVTVAVLDSGIDSTHPDLTYGTNVVQNVKVADLQGSSPAFLYPQVIEGLSDTDLALGHGTFVAGVIAGTGSASDGYYGGMAPGANLLGVSCGDASLFFVLSGIDYILSHKDELNIRVVNCSFGISGLFDANDPVNVATRIMHDAGISVVFSAGNRGGEPNSLNPYSVADWVIGVGSGTKSGSLSSFSSRGAAGYGMFHPTLIAPGESIVSTRAAGINVVGTSSLSAGLASPDNDLRTIPLPYIPRYTCSSGTSFAAPHVAGTIALMLQANPALTVDQIKQILQQTATPMLGYSSYEVGAGYLNTYAAVRKAGLGKPYGAFRAGINNQRITYSRDPVSQLSGSVAPGLTYSRTFNIPADALFATIEVGWIPNGSLINNLRATLIGPTGTVSLPDPGLIALPAFKKTGVSINDPASGSWTISIANNSFLSGAQQVVIAVEIFRASYSVSGLNQLSTPDKALVKRALRTGLLTTSSADFSGAIPATRLDVARVVMLGGGARIPQYLPDSPSFSDEPDEASAVLIESVTHSPFGDLLGSAESRFYPQSSVNRTTVAIAIVKALGLESDAQAASSINPGLVDWNQIPIAARGYVSLAISRNLMRASSGMFRPNDSITRLELALSGVSLQQAAR